MNLWSVWKTVRGIMYSSGFGCGNRGKVRKCCYDSYFLGFELKNIEEGC